MSCLARLVHVGIPAARGGRGSLVLLGSHRPSAATWLPQ